MEEEKKTNSNKGSETAFKSVKIGNQEWMSENLNVDHFRNGDVIPEVKSKDDWKEALQYTLLPTYNVSSMIFQFDDGNKLSISLVKQYTLEPL